MQPGWYVLDEVHIQSAKIHFTLQLSQNTKSPLLLNDRSSRPLLDITDSTQHKSFLVWPKIESLEAHLSLSETINLEQTNSIKLSLITGWNTITTARLSLRAASAGLRLHTADTEAVNGEIAIVDKSHTGSIVVDELVPNSAASFQVPYSVEGDPREIGVRVSIKYTTPEGEFALSFHSSLPTNLPLAINVQDSFKQSLLVSKFTIGTSSAVPVRIAGCYLEGNQDFRVILPPWSGDELDVFVRQPLSLISKVYRNPQRNCDSSSLSNKLFLRLEYRCVEADVYAAIENRFFATLRTSRFAKFARALRPPLLAMLRTRVATQDLETICVTNKINVGGYEKWDWDDVVASFPPDVEGLERWLRDWHEVRKLCALCRIPLTFMQQNQRATFEKGDVYSPMQYLIVPVEIPQMQIVHTAYLRRRSTASEESPELGPVPIDEGVPMELSISHTRAWDDKNVAGSGDQALDFCLEVQANPDTWVIGGQRKAHFSSAVSVIIDIGGRIMSKGNIGRRNLEVRIVAVAPENRTPPPSIIEDSVSHSFTQSEQARR